MRKSRNLDGEVSGWALWRSCAGDWGGLSAHRGRVFLSLGKFIGLCWHFGLQGTLCGILVAAEEDPGNFHGQRGHPVLCLCWSFGPWGLQSRSYSPVHHAGWMCLLDDFAKCKNCRHNLWTLHFIFTKKERIVSPRQSFKLLQTWFFFSLFLKWLKVEKLRHFVETYFCSAGCSPPVGWFITCEWASLYT